MKKVWTFDNRLMLKAFLSEGYRATDVARRFEVNSQTIYNEIKKGMDESTYEQGRYSQYDPYVSMMSEVKRVIGEDGFEALKAYLIKNK